MFSTPNGFNFKYDMNKIMFYQTVLVLHKQPCSDWDFDCVYIRMSNIKLSVSLSRDLYLLHYAIISQRSINHPCL